MNPFEAPSSETPYSAVHDRLRETERKEAPPFSIVKSFLTWGIICSISSIPSFLSALSIARDAQWALYMGIFTFILLYVYADYATHAKPWRRRWSIRLSMRIVYAIRLVISIIYPIGQRVDMICGLVSSMILQPIRLFDNSVSGPMNGQLPAYAVYLWTLSQGVVLNIALACLWIPVWLVCMYASRADKE